MQAPEFNIIARRIRSDPDAVVLKGPKGKPKGGSIPTGTLGYTDEHGQYRDLCLTGPPCSLFPIVDHKTGLVRYPKASIRLVKETDLENPDALHTYARERAEFTLFVRDIEDKVVTRVKADPETYFLKPIPADRILLNTSIKPPINPEWSAIMSCKLDVNEDAPSSRENLESQHVRLIIRDVDGNRLRLDQMRSGDVYLPIFQSTYPWFSSRGEVGIQWRLNTLQILVRGAPDLRESSADGDGIRCDLVLQKYLLTKRELPSEQEEETQDDLRPVKRGKLGVEESDEGVTPEVEAS